MCELCVYVFVCHAAVGWLDRVRSLALGRQRRKTSLYALTHTQVRHTLIFGLVGWLHGLGCECGFAWPRVHAQWHGAREHSNGKKWESPRWSQVVIAKLSPDRFANTHRPNCIEQQPHCYKKRLEWFAPVWRSLTVRFKISLKLCIHAAQHTWLQLQTSAIKTAS